MPWRNDFGWIALVAALLMLAACQPVRPVTQLTPVSIDAPALSGEEQGIADAVLQFVAGQINVAPEMLRVQSVEAMQWPDASLGCPQPDMIYAAVVTPGYLVTVEHGDETYAVHTDSRIDGEKIICLPE